MYNRLVTKHIGSIVVGGKHADVTTSNHSIDVVDVVSVLHM